MLFEICSFLCRWVVCSCDMMVSVTLLPESTARQWFPIHCSRGSSHSQFMGQRANLHMKNHELSDTNLSNFLISAPCSFFTLSDFGCSWKVKEIRSAFRFYVTPAHNNRSIDTVCCTMGVRRRWLEGVENRTWWWLETAISRIKLSNLCDKPSVWISCVRISWEFDVYISVHSTIIMWAQEKFGREFILREISKYTESKY